MHKYNPIYIRPDWFENYTLNGGTYPYGLMRRIPTPTPGSFSAALLSFSDFFVQKYLVDYQRLLQRLAQILNYLANKENKVLFYRRKEKNHIPPKLCTKARATAPWNRWVKPPANKLIKWDWLWNLQVSLLHIFVLFFASLLAFAVHNWNATTNEQLIRRNVYAQRKNKTMCTVTVCST